MQLQTYFLGIYKDNLYRNSFFIMITSLSSSIIGFIFWFFAAKQYLQSDVGIATAIISSITFLVYISKLGFDQSIIRFFPNNNKSEVFFTSIFISLIFTIIVGSIYIIGIDFFAKDLQLLKNYFLQYLLFLSANLMLNLGSVAFIAMRKTQFYFIQSLINGSKIMFLFPLAIMGSLGIFYSFGLSSILGFIFTIIVLFYFGIKIKPIKISYLKKSFNFTSSNYLSNILTTGPNMLLPLLVLNVLGSKASATYYISYSIFNILFMISYSFSTSLFVEGSHGVEIHKSIKKSLFASILILVISVFGIYFLGEYLLSIIGKNYTNGKNLLQLMALSTFFIAFCQTYFSVLKIKKEMKKLLFFSFIIGILLIGLSFNLSIKIGLEGIGFGWILSYLVCSIIIIILNYGVLIDNIKYLFGEKYKNGK